MTICLRQDRSCKAPRRVLIIPMQGVGEYQILCICTLIKTAVFFSPLPLLQYGILTCVSPNAPACTHCLGKLVSRGFSWFFISFSLFFHNEIRVDEQYNFPTVLYTTAYVLESQHVFITKKPSWSQKNLMCFVIESHFPQRKNILFVLSLFYVCFIS